MNDYTKEELQEALRSIASTISKCEKVLPKLKQGSSQHTLLIRRIKAFNIASALITNELRNKHNIECRKGKKLAEKLDYPSR